MKCKYCGEELDEGAKFCTYCGKPVVVEEAEPIEVEEAPAPVEEAPAESEKNDIVTVEVVEQPQQEKKKIDLPPVDLSSMKDLLAYIKNPFSKEDVGGLPAALTGVCAILVNTWLMRSTIMYYLRYAIAMYSYFGGVNMDVTLLNQMGYTFGRFLTGGFLFTLVLFVAFLVVEFIHEEKSLDGVTRSMQRAGALLLVPTLLNVLACIGWQVHFYLAAFFMALSFMTQILIIHSRLGEKMNPYIRIVVLALISIAILSSFVGVLLS